jgi:uncharacterized protein YdbL (DUF1318 family)
MRRLSRLSLSSALATAFAACITVNIYFPAPQVRAAAEEIVEETWGDGASHGAQGPADAAPDEAAPNGGGALLDIFAPASAWAAEDHANVDVSTAAIRALKEAMKGRAAELKRSMATGAVGIGNDGMLAARDVSGLPLAEQAKVRRLVEAENRDRKALYAEIAEANGYPRDRVKDIQEIFAQTWIDKAESGWSIQKPDGSWSKK